MRLVSRHGPKNICQAAKQLKAGNTAKTTVSALLVLVAASAISAASAGSASADVTSNPGGPVVAVEDPGNALDVFWQANGTPYHAGQWHLTGLEDEAAPYQAAGGVGFWRVADQGTTFSAPSVANDNGSTVIAVQGPNHSLDFYWAPAWDWSSAHPSFTEERVAGANTTYSAPTLVVADNHVDIVAEGAHNTLDFYSVRNGQNFSLKTPPTVVGKANSTFSAPSITANGNGLNIAAVGYEGLMDFYWDVNGSRFSSANVVNPYGFFQNLSAPSITANGRWVTIVSEGQYSSLEMWSAWNGTSRWYYGPGYFTPYGTWVSVPEPVTNGDVLSVPQAAWTGGELSIVSSGIGGSVMYFRQDASGLHVRQALPYGASSGAPPRITPNNRSVNIEAQDSSDQVFYAWQRLGARGWGVEQWSQAYCSDDVCTISL
jgi:hypothetical protein